MKCINKYMIDAEIKYIIKTYDYYQIFTDKVVINIYNPFVVLNELGENINLTTKEVINKKIKDIDYKKNCIFSIKLSNGYEINIIIEDKYYTGPEAFEININEGRLIIVE